MVVISKRNCVYVRNVYDPEWSCKIDEGIAGLLSARWTPDSRFVLTVSEFKLRMTIWDLKLTKNQKQKPLYIDNPKFENQGVDFSGNSMACVRKFLDGNGEAKDMISIFNTHSWHCSFSFFPDLKDCADIRFINDHLVAWESDI